MVAKKIKAKVLYIFNDNKEDIIRKPGEVFETTKTRIAEINKASNEYFGKDYVIEVPDDTKEEKENC